MYLSRKSQDTERKLSITVKAVSTIEKCQASVKLSEQKYNNVQFSVFKGLLTDLVLGQDFIQRHQSVSIHFGGAKSPLKIWAPKTTRGYL